MCVTTYLKAMLTDGFLLSVSSRAANYAPHRLTMLHGELSATSPAHHRMAINHLLHRLIYNALLRTRCHTEGKVWLLLKELWTLLSALFFIRVSCVLDFSKCEQVGHEPTGNWYSLPALCIVMELKNLLHCQYADDIQSDDKCGKHRNREYGAKEVFFYCFLVGSTENL